MGVWVEGGREGVVSGMGRYVMKEKTYSSPVCREFEVISL